MFRKLAIAATLALGVTSAAQAVTPTYPTPGTANVLDYSFTAAATGDIVAYFVGHTAGYTNLLGMSVNGVDTGIWGLNNQTTAPGTSLNFGPVNAGDTLVFKINVTNTGEYFYSQRSLNGDGITHIFSAAYAGGDFGIPAGTYVGFEDLNGGGDLDYDDLRFVFTNVKGVEIGGVPEPTTWAMLIAGFGLVGAAARRRKGIAVTSA
ncbi:PEPxxWA-CTERM sorting domain-containing protein [Sandaracinobacteroides hominis]|uniref:PEPxxWA-CTERM sorting domain-containing protein n=1 Tax=Sandaracinobacteroides hominis TaxID=2780086 RepID=UPI0018F67EE6|nr:PEPxxWA-CTERM sorting domain-containing protein [Sandaracinobacteroides hominis]